MHHVLSRRPFLWALTISVALLAGSAQAGATELTVLLEDYRALQLAAQGISVQEQTVEIGHLELALREGLVVPLHSRDGEVLGFYYEGSGRYTYRSEDPADRQIMPSNLAARSNAEIYRDHELSDRLERMVFFFSRPVFEELLGMDATVAIGDDVRRRFGKVWGRIAKTSLEYDHLAADGRLNGGDRQYVYAEIVGSKETLGYSFDRVRRYEERVFLFRKISGYDLRFQTPVSTQIIGDGTKPTPVWLRHVDVEVETDDNRNARIVSDLQFEVGEDDLSLVPLLLLNNRDPYQYAWESDRNRLQILKVTDGSGRELPYSHRHHEVVVQLAEPVSAGDEIRLHFETEGEVLTGMDGTHSDSYFELFSVHWFPRPFDSSATNFTMNLKARTHKPYRPVANGNIVRFDEVEGDAYVLETRSERPIRMVALFAGKYKVNEEVIDGIPIRIFGYAQASKRTLSNMPKLAGAFLKFFRDTLGPYPFEQLNIIEVPDYGFGIAPPGTVLLTTDAYKPHQDYIAGYFSRGVNARLAHEIAHQWFGHRAWPASSRDNWLTESFAEYIAGLAVGAIVGKNARVKGFDEIFIDWWTETLDSRDAGAISAANMLSGPNAGRDRYYLLYARGPLVLRMLHSMVGNDGFYAILRGFLDKADMGNATTDDFRKATEAVVGMDMQWFFDQWIHEGGVPEIKVDYSVQQTDGKALLAGKAVSAEDQPFKRMRIPIVLEFGSAQPVVRWVELNEPTTEFSFELPGKPTKVKVDPARNFLAQFK